MLKKLEKEAILNNHRILTLETIYDQMPQFRDLQSVTKIVRLVPPPPYSMLVASLPAHLWSWLPGNASSGLAQH